MGQSDATKLDSLLFNSGLGCIHTQIKKYLDCPNAEKPSLQSRHSLDSSRVQEKEAGPLWITLALQKQKGFREQQQSREERRSQREAKLAEKQARDRESVTITALLPHRLADLPLDVWHSFGGSPPVVSFLMSPAGDAAEPDGQ